MVQVRFPDAETERKALGFLAGRFSFKSFDDGTTLVPNRALSYLAAQGIRFTVGVADNSRHLVASLFEQAVDLFEGDAAAARRWLAAPNRALGGESPLSFAETEPGVREVERLIGRLEHGVVT